MIYQGIITALITPFKDNKIDYLSLENLINNQIKAEINSILIGGSTGEGSSFSEEEYYELLSMALKFADNKIKIIANLKGLDTNFDLKRIKQLSNLNLSGLMCTMPPYVKPEQKGICQHFKALNDASNLPIMIYIHPSRTGVDISDNTLLELSKLDKITAVKDCSNDLEKPIRLAPIIREGFAFLTGDDSSTLAYSANGGMGCVSVLSNILPKIVKKIYQYCQSNDFHKALKLQQKILPLINAIFLESNPIGVKCAANIMQLCTNELRLPLTSSNSETESKIKNTIKEAIKLEQNV
ncbi:MAG: 4-hydroxy-tetrahydrodipicolinate synthase [Rickettsiales bacterium]|nr:MAG: 4-hydroxy-tetrahydrodipicolinate synthase [Rickettsiales bacterium]